MAGEQAHGVITVVEYDFASRRRREVSLSEVATIRPEDRFVWVSVEKCGQEEILRAFDTLGIPESLRAGMVQQEAERQLGFCEKSLYFSLSEVIFQGETARGLRLDVVVVPGMMLTICADASESLKQMRAAEKTDFERHSHSFGFLLFELADALCDHYRRMLQQISPRVQALQAKAFDAADDRLFSGVSGLMRSLHLLRNAVVDAREALHELSHRRSDFIPETTQPHLAQLAETLDRLGSDLEGERQILGETLQLYMGMTAHQTGRIVNRLTAITMIFMPLTFLCGVYGMNFDHQPELRWTFGYAGFWVVAILLATGIFFLMRRARWL